MGIEKDIYFDNDPIDKDELEKLLEENSNVVDESSAFIEMIKAEMVKEENKQKLEEEKKQDNK